MTAPTAGEEAGATAPASQVSETAAPEPVTPAAPLISLFGDTPAEAYQRMQAIVETLRIALPQNRDVFLSEIVFNEGKKNERRQLHVTIEGWTFVGGLCGLSARTKWTRRFEDEVEVEEWAGPQGQRRKEKRRVLTHGYEAHAEAVTLHGQILGGHEGMCIAAESRWANADEYARRSMAQTRAKSQAIAGVLRFLVEMAGFRGTPAEEMTGVEDRTRQQAVEGPQLTYGTPQGLVDALTQAWGNDYRWEHLINRAVATYVGKDDWTTDLSDEVMESIRQRLVAVGDDLLAGDFPPPDGARVVQVFADAFGGIQVADADKLQEALVAADAARQPDPHAVDEDIPFDGPPEHLADGTELDYR
jgi:hypothetical protein